MHLPVEALVLMNPEINPHSLGLPSNVHIISSSKNWEENNFENDSLIEAAENFLSDAKVN